MMQIGWIGFYRIASAQVNTLLTGPQASGLRLQCTLAARQGQRPLLAPLPGLAIRVEISAYIYL